MSLHDPDDPAPGDSPRDGSPDPQGDTSLHIRRARDGDARSLEEVVRRLSPLLLAEATYRLKAFKGDAVEPADLVNETWLRTLPRLEELTPREGRIAPVLLKYMSTALRRRARDLLIARLRHRPAPSEDDDRLSWLPDETRGIVTRLVEDERRGTVRRALEELAATDREVIILRGIEQASTREVAAIVGISEDAVKQRYRRALHRLRDSIPNSVFHELSSEPAP